MPMFVLGIYTDYTAVFIQSSIYFEYMISL